MMSYPTSVTSIVCSTLWYRASLFPMHSRERRATDGMSSVRCASVDRNLRLKWVERYAPSASDANSGTVIMRAPTHAVNSDTLAAGCPSKSPFRELTLSPHFPALGAWSQPFTNGKDPAKRGEY